MDTFGSNYFPGVSIVHVLGSWKVPGISDTLNIGPNATSQGSNTGVFQNRLQPSGNAIWTNGKHTIGFGGSYSFTQLNTIDRRTGTGSVASADLGQFFQGAVTPNDSYNVTTFLQGDANRYFRANQLGLFLQDKFQIKPNLTLTAGLRYDWDGGITEKYGRIFNFDPSLYSYITTTGPLPDRRDSRIRLVLPKAASSSPATIRTEPQGSATPRSPAASGALRRGSARHGSRQDSTTRSLSAPAWACTTTAESSSVTSRLAMPSAWSQEDRSAPISKSPSSLPKPAPPRVSTRITSPTCGGGTAGSLEFPTPMSKPCPHQPQGVGFLELSAQRDLYLQRSRSCLPRCLRPEKQTALLD